LIFGFGYVVGDGDRGKIWTDSASLDLDLTAFFDRLDVVVLDLVTGY
jgi:hypothetical protein